MTFTELEYVLMIAVAVLVWRVAVVSRALSTSHNYEYAAHKALYLLAVGAAEIVKTDRGYAVTPNEKEHDE
jgi:hypothetical protein